MRHGQKIVSLTFLFMLTATVCSSEEKYPVPFSGGTKTGYAYIDGEIKIVIPQIYDDARNFSEGYAAVCVGSWKDCSQWGFIDTKGRVVVPLKYEYVWDFKNRFARVKDGSRFRYVNNKGEFISNDRYDDAMDFYDSMARIKIRGKWGYINTTGKIVVEPVFDFAKNYSDGAAEVKKGEESYYIDNAGAKIHDIEKFKEMYKQNLSARRNSNRPISIIESEPKKANRKEYSIMKLGSNISGVSEKEYNSDGKLVSIREFFPPDTLHGKSETYYDNGQIKEECVWENGKVVGKLKTYHKNGQKSSQKEFSKGSVISGSYKQWDEDGNLIDNNKNVIFYKKDGVYGNIVRKLNSGFRIVFEPIVGTFIQGDDIYIYDDRGKYIGMGRVSSIYTDECFADIENESIYDSINIKDIVSKEQGSANIAKMIASYAVKADKMADKSLSNTKSEIDIQMCLSKNSRYQTMTREIGYLRDKVGNMQRQGGTDPTTQAFRDINYLWDQIRSKEEELERVKIEIIGECSRNN